MMSPARHGRRPTGDFEEGCSGTVMATGRAHHSHHRLLMSEYLHDDPFDSHRNSTASTGELGANVRPAFRYSVVRSINYYHSP